MPKEPATIAWIGRLGRMSLTINAKTRAEAMDASADHAGNLYFHTEQTLSERDPWPLDARAEASPAMPDDALQGGAWQVVVARIGHSIEGRDS
jgi:hypothetical protein